MEMASNADQSLAVNCAIGRRRRFRRRRHYRQHRGQPLHFDRRLLHFLPHHGVSGRRSVFPTLGASQQQRRRAAELRRLPHPEDQLVRRNLYPRHFGLRKMRYAEFTHNFSDPKLWEARRIELAPEVDAEMRAQDSVTCRSCHDANAIHPTSKEGQKAHALLRQGGVTCVDCHTNIVHPPAPPPAASPQRRQRARRSERHARRTRGACRHHMP